LSVNLKIIGALYVLCALVGFWDAIKTLIFGIIVALHPEGTTGDLAGAHDYFLLFQGLGILILAALLLHFGISLWRQRKWALGVTGYIISALLLFAIPLGTILGLYTLVSLFMARSPPLASDR
jgi:hypothetical protein